MLEVVGLAIEQASKVRAFGLYDYSKYPGDTPPHVVENEITGERVLQSWDKDEARAKYEECCRRYIASAAIKAMDQWRFEAADVIIIAARLRGLSALKDDYGQIQHEKVRKALEASSLSSTPAQAAPEPLTWLAEHKNHELSFSGWDGDPAWQVHSVTGGRNDREWTLRATGGTPDEALRKAMAAPC
jgi:hypothetical protein